MSFRSEPRSLKSQFLAVSKEADIRRDGVAQASHLPHRFKPLCQHEPDRDDAAYPSIRTAIRLLATPHIVRIRPLAMPTVRRLPATVEPPPTITGGESPIPGCAPATGPHADRRRRFPPAWPPTANCIDSERSHKCSFPRHAASHIRLGDVILVDETGRAGTRNLNALHTIAEKRATIRPLGTTGRCPRSSPAAPYAMTPGRSPPCPTYSASAPSC